jgi:hypothetical protein
VTGGLTQNAIDARNAALATLGKNRMAFARNQIPAIALSARSAVLQQPQPNQNVQRIALVPYAREAHARRGDIESKLFGLQKSYEEYGSSNGDWRNLSTNGKWWSTPRAFEPRRSLRLRVNQ